MGCATHKNQFRELLLHSAQALFRSLPRPITESRPFLKFCRLSGFGADTLSERRMALYTLIVLRGNCGAAKI